MIITAEIARKQAKKIREGKNKSIKKITSDIRQLREVEIAINRASIKGKQFIEFHCLKDSVLEVLKNNGYRIQNCGNYDYEWLVIIWD